MLVINEGMMQENPSSSWTQSKFTVIIKKLQAHKKLLGAASLELPESRASM